MEEKLKILIIKVIFDKFGIKLDNIKLENPPKKDMGDYAFGCFLLSKELRKNPNEIANDLVDLFNGVNEIESVNSVGPYLNFKISKNIYSDILNDLYSKKEKLIGISENRDETIYIDYIGTNVGKPMHIGHICPATQGQVFVNLYKKLGYNVISDSHLGDWGIIFGKLIVAYKLWGDELKLKDNAVEHLFKLYVKVTAESEKDDSLDQKFRSAFKNLSTGDAELIKLWESFTKESIKSMQVQLDRLNIKSIYNIGESFYEGLGLSKMENYPDLKWSMGDIVSELIEKGIATKNEDGSVGVVFDEGLKIPSCILQKKDGTNLYFTSDLAAIKYRIDNWKPKKIIYFVDARQQLHFKQAFIISKLAGWIVNEDTELFHAYNGFISLKDGAMSTRKGRIIKLDKLLDESEDRAKNIILEKNDSIVGLELDKISKIIGIGAIKYGYLKKSRETDIVFDWDEFMSFEGNSGPYIQYAYVRSIRILEKYGKEIDDKNIGILENQEEIELIKLIGNYYDILSNTAKNNMAHYLCQYTYELTKSFNSFYNNVHILNEKDDGKKIIRLKLVKLFGLVLKDSFNILGIDMPDKM